MAKRSSLHVLFIFDEIGTIADPNLWLSWNAGIGD